MDKPDGARCEPGQFTQLSPAERENARREIVEAMRPVVENMTPDQRWQLQQLSNRLRGGAKAKREREERKGGRDAVR